MSDFGVEMGHGKSILTQLTENLYEAFDGTAPGEFKTAHLLLWIRGLDPSDDANAYVIDCVRRNRGWVKLLASRVRKYLERQASAAQGR